jgi:hypothetical protein
LWFGCTLNPRRKSGLNASLITRIITTMWLYLKSAPFVWKFSYNRNVLYFYNCNVWCEAPPLMAGKSSRCWYDYFGLFFASHTYKKLKKWHNIFLCFEYPILNRKTQIFVDNSMIHSLNFMIIRHRCQKIIIISFFNCFEIKKL